MATELPTTYHAARNAYMTGKLGGEMTQNPTTHVINVPHQTRQANVVGPNAPSSLHNMFGASGKR
jgi:hypothetical protein